MAGQIARPEADMIDTGGEMRYTGIVTGIVRGVFFNRLQIAAALRCRPTIPVTRIVKASAGRQLFVSAAYPQRA